jgi:hypothetical protein
MEILDGLKERLPYRKEVNDDIFWTQAIAETAPWNICKAKIWQSPYSTQREINRHAQDILPNLLEPVFLVLIFALCLLI